MPKINIKVSLKSPNENLKNKYIGLYQDDVLKYFEDADTKMTYYYKTNILKRETKDLIMKFYFDKEVIKINYKELDMNMDINIKVNRILIKDKDIEVEYTLENPNEKEKFIYRIEVLK